MNVRGIVLVNVILGGCTIGGYSADFEGAPPELLPPDELPPSRVPEERIPEATPIPPPISGGSLAVRGDRAVVGDPDTDAIYVVSLSGRSVVGRVSLLPGSEPGRVAFDGAGRAHVALRRTGEVITIDPANASVLGRRRVCAAPRGLVWRESDDSMIVACADGVLAFYRTTAGSVRSLRVADDLRDVVLVGDRMLVSRFRSAEVLTLDANGNVLDTRRPPVVRNQRFVETMRLIEGDFEEAMLFDANVAWRMIPFRDGALLLHQRSTRSTLGTDPSGYGFGDTCGSIVNGAMSFVPADGPITEVSNVLAQAVLPVDVTYDSSTSTFAIATPGTTVAHQNFGGVLTIAGDRFADIQIFGDGALHLLDEMANVSCDEPVNAANRTLDGGSTVAVASTADFGLVSFARSPSRLQLEGAFAIADSIVLSDTNTEHRGHEYFHAMTGAGVACASCHPEAGDDGRAWRFQTIGARRTQTMRGGILGTEPFHWDGDMTSFSTLLSHVFAGRMGGPLLDEANGAVFSRWMDALPALPRPAEDPARVVRGQALFVSAQCSTCHAGESFTNNLSVDVGTGHTFQVPTLVGIAHRAPYMHDGCAPTLEARLTDPVCGGGDRHGRTSTLTAAERDDLVAYLRTL
jgi:hypothetical protein